MPVSHGPQSDDLTDIMLTLQTLLQTDLTDQVYFFVFSLLSGVCLSLCLSIPFYKVFNQKTLKEHMLFHYTESNRKNTLKKILLYTYTLSHFLHYMALLRVMDLSGKDIISLTAKKIDIYYTTTRKTLAGKHQHDATGAASTGLHALQKFCLTIPFFFLHIVIPMIFHVQMKVQFP